MMSMVTLKIDGREVTVPSGTTVLEAAQQKGISIPTLCHDPELTRPGACRICVVEIPGMRNLPASCVTEVFQGMEVLTSSPAVVEARKTIIDLLLANHPEDCLTCEKTGTCKLAEYAYAYGVRKTSFVGDKTSDSIDDTSAVIIRDINKCILCGKCVRVCDEIVGRHIMDFTYRGFTTKVGPALEMGLGESDCVSCGSCVAVCPVGALTEKQMKGLARSWEVKKVKTTCPYCGTGCNFDLNVKDGKVIGVTSNPTSPVNGRHLCVKGRFGYDFIHSPDRLTTPLIRKDGELVEASWDEALDLVAGKFTEIKEEFGGDALASLTSARCTNEDNYLMNKLARVAFGTNNIDHCARLWHAPTVASLAAAFGSGAMTNSIEEVGNTEFLMVTGSNTTEAHPVISLQVRQALKKGAKLVVIDPRKIELADLANRHLQLKPGTNIALFNAMINVILEENLYNKEFVETRTESFEEMKEAAADYTPEYAAEITGVPAEDIRAVARDYAKAGSAMILYTMGITQHNTGTHNVMTIANLAMLCGHVGKLNSGVCPLRGQNNVQGACDMGGLPTVYPGYQPVISPEAQEKFEKAWGISLSSKPGLTLGEMLDGASEGTIKGLYILGENPMLSDPDVNHVEHALKHLDFLVVQDIFLTETAKLADVVLPGASFAEKDGTFSNTERRIQRVRKAVEPVGDSRVDWEIIAEISTRMGYPMKYNSAAEVMAEIAKVTPSYGGISYERLERECPQWPCPTPDHPGTRFLHEGKFVRGLGKFHAIEYVPPAEDADQEYPFVLTTGRRLAHYHTGTMTRRSKGLDTIMPEDYLEINPEDACRMGLESGDQVKVSSRRGEMTIKARVSDWVKPGIVFSSFHFAESPVNYLTDPTRDPIAKIPALKVSAVKIEKIG